MNPTCPIKKSTWQSQPYSAWGADDQALFPTPDAEEDPFADLPASASWSVRYRDDIKHVNTYWLGFLKKYYPDRLSWPPASRFTVDAIKEFDTRLASDGVATSTRASYFTRLLALARNSAPEVTNWDWFEEGVADLRRKAEAVRQKPVVDANDLLDLGFRLMNEALEDTTASDLQRAIKFRDGLMIAAWITSTARASNFASLRIDDNLEVNGGTVRIVVDATKVKNRRGISVLLPELLIIYLRFFIDHVRPLFKGSKEHSFLFASKDGCGMTPGSLSRRHKLITLKYLKVAIPAHAVRYSAATTISLTTPISKRIAMFVLNHGDIGIGSDSYDQKTCLDAQRKFLESIRSRSA